MVRTRTRANTPREALEEARRRNRLLREREARQLERDPIWRPYPGGPQERALESAAYITGFGGAAGSGKTDLVLGAAATRHRRSIIFRREFPQLRGLVERSHELFEGRGQWNGQDKLWRGLPGGRAIEFGAVQYETDKTKYRGRPHDLLAIDESTEFYESVFWFLLGWLRTTIPDQRCRAILTFNPPTNEMGRWVVRLFAPWLDRTHPDPALPGELRWFARVDGEMIERPDGEPFEHRRSDERVETIRPMSRTFFPARLADNPVLAATGYGSTLQLLPEPLRSQLLYGDFDAGIQADPWQVIPTAWVEAAMRRWRERHGIASEPLTCLGMDVAHGGADKTVIAPRFGDFIGPLAKYPGSETPDGRSAAGRCLLAYEPGAYVNVDAIGYGASAAERLADPEPDGYGISAHAVNVAARSEHRDRSGKFRLVNQRAEMYWRLREELDPEFGATLALPDDPELLADLTAPRFEITIAGIRIEEKAALSLRLPGGRSPDCGDAVALTMLPEPQGAHPVIPQLGGTRTHLPGSRW